MKLFLAPHNDDETLFGAFTLMRHDPRVVVVLRSFVEETWDGGPTWEERETETHEALSVLGMTDCWDQLHARDDDPDWDWVASTLTVMYEDVEHVWAPAIEEGGHAHHNAVGAIVSVVFPADRVTYYLTYTHRRGRSIGGYKVPHDEKMMRLKEQALAKYASQIRLPQTRMQFDTEQCEYYTHVPTPMSVEEAIELANR